MILSRGYVKIPAFLVFFFLGLSSWLFAEVGLEVRNASYFSARDFKRIPEFFTGQEYEGSKVYCRSNQSERQGFYFVVKVNGSSTDLSLDAYWKLDLITSINPAAQSIKIPINNPKIFGKEIFIGLTGNDWPDPSAQVLAWRLSLLCTEGSIIAKKQSFLWSK